MSVGDFVWVWLLVGLDRKNGRFRHRYRWTRMELISEVTCTS